MRIHDRTGRVGRGSCVFRKRLPLLCAAALLLFETSPAAAQTPQPASPSVTATVVSIDDGDLVLDLGTTKGAQVGDVVELWRPLKLRHPVSGKWLEDRFRIGTLVLTQVGTTLTLAQPEGKPSRGPEPGDIVVLHPTPPASTTPETPVDGAPVQPLPRRAPSDETSPADPEAQRLSAIFDSLQGADLVRRIRAYEDYVRANPEGRFAAVLYEEAQSLRGLLAQRPPASPEPVIISFHRPEELLSATPTSIAIEASEVTAGAVVHVRTTGDTAYTSVPMQQMGPGYWSATIDGDHVRAPGLEYFIEGTTPRGNSVQLIAAADRPDKTLVREMPKPEPPRRLDATFSLLTDYADYNRLRGDDFAWQTEGYFGLRYQDVGVRAVRTGFGVYRGAGGTLEDLDTTGKGPRSIGLTYGYLELEVGASPFVSFIGRGAVGLEDEGTAGGGQAMIRIGNDRSTNLMLGGEFLGGVGMRGFTQLELNTFERVPILLRSEVTNQPAGITDHDPRPVDDQADATDTSQDRGDLGARGIVQVGYRVIPTLTIAGRVSYQGRTIKHAGPGVGAAVTYAW